MKKENEIKHTPGPWEFIVGRGYPVILNESSRTHVAKMDCSVSSSNWVKDYDEAIANARLIAAAPDLLEAAREAMAVCAALQDGFDVARIGTAHIWNLKNMTEAAIAKAEGNYTPNAPT